MPIVVSTLSQGQDYVFYETREEKNGQITNIEKHRISIKGGQGVVDRRTLIAPDGGVTTEISDADAALLKTHPAFKQHEKAGYGRIVGMQIAVKGAVKHMEPEDDSAQLTDDDLGDVGTPESEGLKVNGRNIQPRAKGRSRKRK